MDHDTAQYQTATDRTTTPCAHCGQVADELPLTWACSVEGGSRRYFCDRCARDNLRSIESRLDSALW